MLLGANEILSSSNLESMGFSGSNGWTIKNGLPVHNFQSAGGGGGTSDYADLTNKSFIDNYATDILTHICDDKDLECIIAYCKIS